MLPIVSEENAAEAFSEIFKDMPTWRKKMIHYVKDENPEINTAIIEAATKTKGITLPHSEQLHLLFLRSTNLDFQKLSEKPQINQEA